MPVLAALCGAAFFYALGVETRFDSLSQRGRTGVGDGAQNQLGVSSMFPHPNPPRWGREPCNRLPRWGGNCAALPQARFNGKFSNRGCGFSFNLPSESTATNPPDQRKAGVQNA